jgi:hypothetical protein
MFLNPSEGAVYSCVTGGVPSVATWQYEMTLSGGSGGTSDYTDLTNKPSINGHTLLGNQTGADLGLANSSDIPTVDQTYSATSSNAQSGKAVAQAIGALDKSDSAVSGQYVSAVSETDGIITVSRASLPSDTKNTAGTTNSTSKLFLAGATSQAANPQTYSNVNCYASGGHLYSNGLQVATDGWTETKTVQSDMTVTFSGLNDNYGYDLYCQNKLVGISAMTKTGSGTSVTLKFTLTGAAQGDTCKLRIIRN